MYNAIVDIGNSKVKIAIFKNEEFILLQQFDEWNDMDYYQTTKGYLIKKIIVSDVRYRGVLPYQSIMNDIPLSVIFDATTPIPMSSVYESPESLGYDRLALCIGARSFYEQGALLVISAGTCITYNFVNEKNEFVGGSISPGIHMRYKALNHFTGKLPLLQATHSDDQFALIGKNTNNAIHSGVLLGAVAEVDGIIDIYKENYNNLTVILSGGDWSFLAHSLKNKIFAHPNLVLFGLNRILNFYVEKK